MAERSYRDKGRLMARRTRTTPGTHPSGPLPTAAAAGDIKALSALLDGGHAPDGRDREGNTALRTFGANSLI